MSKEEERGAKVEDSAKPFFGPSIMKLFRCSYNRYSKNGNMSTIQESEFSWDLLENKYPLTNHPLKEKFINLPKEELGSASNESIDEEKEEGSIGTNHLDGKDEEEDKVPNPFSILEKGYDSISYSSDQGK